MTELEVKEQDYRQVEASVSAGSATLWSSAELARWPDPD
jgi:hypothetical protein